MKTMGRAASCFVVDTRAFLLEQVSLELNFLNRIMFLA